MCNIQLRVIWSGLGVLLTVAGTLVLGIHYSNYSSTAFALLASLYVLGLLILHLLYWRDVLDDWTPTHFLVTILSGSVGQLVGIAGIIAFIALGIVHKTDFHQLYGENWWLSIIAASWLWLWAFQLFWRYRKENEQRFLLNLVGGSGAGVGGTGRGGGQMDFNGLTATNNYNNKSSPLKKKTDLISNQEAGVSSSNQPMISPTNGR